MKKLFKTLAVAALFTVTTVSANAQSTANDQELIGKARNAAHECLQSVAGSDVNAFVEATGICFVSGETHRVTFTAGPRCSGNGPCPYFVRLVATVDFDCDGNVIAVTCM